MPVAVKVYTWPPGGGPLAINELNWSMYDLPAQGSRYWHGGDPYVVRSVDETTDPVAVHLEHAQEWAHEIRAALPAGYWLDGGRNNNSGRWHFSIVRDGGAHPVALVHGDTLEQALKEAIAEAHARGG